MFLLVWLFGKRFTMWDVLSFGTITHYSAIGVITTGETAIYYLVSMLFGIAIENLVPENQIAENAVR